MSELSYTTVCLNVIDVEFIDLVLIDLHLLWCLIAFELLP